jgi:hypothetical protein
MVRAREQFSGWEAVWRGKAGNNFVIPRRVLSKKPLAEAQGLKIRLGQEKHGQQLLPISAVV